MLAKPFWQVQASALQRTLQERFNLRALSIRPGELLPGARRVSLLRATLQAFAHQAWRTGQRYHREACRFVVCRLAPSFGPPRETDTGRASAPAGISPEIRLSIYIAATPEQIWKALTDPAITERYWSGTRVESDWQVGSTVLYRWQSKITHEQSVLHAEPHRLLRHSFYPVVAEISTHEPPSRVSFEIAPIGRVTQLTLIHDSFNEGSALYRPYRTFWPMLLSNLKTLLETGKPLFGESVRG